MSGVSGAIRFPDTRHLTPETKNSTTRLVNSNSGGYVHNPILFLSCCFEKENTTYVKKLEI